MSIRISRDSRIGAIVAAAAVVVMSSSYDSAGAYASVDKGFPTGLPTIEAEDGLDFDLGIASACTWATLASAKHRTPRPSPLRRYLRRRRRHHQHQYHHHHHHHHHTQH